MGKKKKREENSDNVIKIDPNIYMARAGTQYVGTLSVVEQSKESPLYFKELGWRIQVEKAVTALSKCASSGQCINYEQAQQIINDLLASWPEQSADVQGRHFYEQYTAMQKEIEELKKRQGSPFRILGW